MSIVFRGGPEAMAKWLPFAVSRQLSLSRLNIKCQSLTPEPGVLIRVQIKPNNIHIDACGGEVSIPDPADDGLNAILGYYEMDGLNWIYTIQHEDHPRSIDDSRRYPPYLAPLPGYNAPPGWYGLVEIAFQATSYYDYNTVAVQGKHVITGSPLYIPPELDYLQDPFRRTGIAYIHDRMSGRLLHTLERSRDTSELRNQFGLSVAISDKVAVVATKVPIRDSREGLEPGEAGSEVVYGRVENWLAERRFDPSVFIYDIESGEEIAALNFNTIRLPHGSPPLTGHDEYVPPEGMDTIWPKHIDHHHAEWFGESVAISNSIVVIGSPREELEKYERPVDVRMPVYPPAYGEYWPIPGSASADEDTTIGLYYQSQWWFGRVYIYSLTDNVLLHELTDPLIGAGDGPLGSHAVQSPRVLWQNDDPETSHNGDYASSFGKCVAISEDLIIVGAAYEHVAVEDFGAACLAYIYSADSGELLHVLRSPDTNAWDVTGYFGSSVDIEVNPRESDTREGRVIVGAPAKGGGTSGIEGPAAYIFDAFTGEHLHTLRNPDETIATGTSFFGDKVGICKGKAIVAASSTEETHHPGYAFVFSTDSGELIKTLDSSTFHKPDIHIFTGVDITHDKDTGCSTAATNDLRGDVKLWGL
jgi:hypothetical protein